MWIVIARALISWVNPDPYNPIVRFLYSATEPLLYRVRRSLPIFFGGIDFSPLIVLVAIYFLQAFLVQSLRDLALSIRWLVSDEPAALRLHIHLQPRAARSRIVGRHGDAIKIQVHAPPVDGAANAALIDLLADTLDVPRRAVRIVQGATGRDKLVEIQSSDPAACRQRLEAALQPRVDKAGGRG
jgi:YggT family protein